MSYDRFDNVSPADYRYYETDVAKYLSEAGYLRYKLSVELALVETFHEMGQCSKTVVDEVRTACKQIPPAEVYAEEEKTKHDIRALVNCIQARVSDEAKPFVHLAATSYDIVDTANAARYKDVTQKVVVPALTELLRVLVDITKREAATVQVGRTHGQHASPITFGFAMAGFADRLGSSTVALQELAGGLRGKFSGATGAYNASGLVVTDPEAFEAAVQRHLGLKPAEHSTQIAPPEPMLRLLSEMVIAGGVMANLARDMRHLQRTEIGEVGEEFAATQVGSSTMPHKRNPINFENVESLWKVLVGRLVTVYSDQVSEHQRDLTGSASGRTYTEIVNYLVAMANRLTRTMSKIKVDTIGINRNLELTGGMVLAEPLYILLAKHGHPDAHEKVRQLTLQAQRDSKTLHELVSQDRSLVALLKQMTESERALLSDPAAYTGLAEKKALTIAGKWAKHLRVP